MKKIVLFTLVLLCVFASKAQEDYNFIKQSFLIIHSTKDYSAALETAKDAEDKLGLEYRESEYIPDETEGFISDVVCGCGEIHGYFPRGSHDDGNYISIEYSSSYDGFSEGYYIVIVSSGQKFTVKKLLPLVKKSFAQAYIKNAEVYVGCMH